MNQIALESVVVELPSLPRPVPESLHGRRLGEVSVQEIICALHGRFQLPAQFMIREDRSGNTDNWL